SGRSPSHLRQRAAVHRSRLQRVHPDLRHDSCADLAVLSAVKRENREVAPIIERRVCPPRRAAIARGGAPSGGPVRRPLQSDSPSQRYRLRHASGQAGGTRAANLRRTRSQAGGSAPAAATSASGSVGPAAVTDGGAAWRFLECGAKLMSPGETEAGSAVLLEAVPIEFHSVTVGISFTASIPLESGANQRNSCAADPRRGYSSLAPVHRCLMKPPVCSS